MNNLVPTTRDHLEELSRHARVADRLECVASYGMDLHQVASFSFEQSEECYTGIKDGIVYGCVGIVPPFTVMSDTACPWLLTTVHVDKSPRILLSNTKPLIEKWLHYYPILENYIDSRYKKALRWAKWAGFTIYPAKPHGEMQIPFHRVEIRRK